METGVWIEEVTAGRAKVADAILRDLPEWFGLAGSRDAYVAAADRLPMLVARTGPEPAGFLSLRIETEAAASIHVLGVLRAHHRRGCGRALVEAARRRLAVEGRPYLTVKTLGAGHPDPHYARTRAFYRAVGFRPVEAFPNFWGEGYPCLLMIRPTG